MIAGIVIAVVVILSAIFGGAEGAPMTQVVSNSYVMGDNDSRADGRQFCVAGAKQKALEAIGTVVESEMEIRSTDAPGGRDDASRRIRSYVAAQIAATVDRVDYGMSDNHMVVHCGLTVTADPEEVRRKLSQIVADTPARRKLDEQQVRIDKLQAEMARLTLMLEAAPMSAGATTAVRAQRLVAETKVADLQTNRAAIIAGIKAQEKSATAIALGMTDADVYAVAGPPRGVNDAFAIYSTRIYNYGAVWVTMFSGSVRCVTKQPDWNCANPDGFIKG